MNNLVCLINGHIQVHAELIHQGTESNWYSRCSGCSAIFKWIYAKTKTGYWKKQ